MALTTPAAGPGLLRNRSFLLLFTGMAVSLLGDALYAIVLPVWVMQATGSAGAMALLSTTATVTGLLIAPLAGAVADRLDRRGVMLAADLVRALLLALLALLFWAGAAHLIPLLVGVALLAAAGAFFSPAYAAAQTGLVHPGDLTRALSLFQVMRQAIAFVGPALAGAVVGLTGSAGALALDGLTFLLSAACLLGVRLRWAPAPPRERRPFWQDFAAGLGLIAGSRVILRTLTLAAGVNLAGAGFSLLLPVIALREMGLKPEGYGLFLVVSPAGVMLGMLLVTAVAGRITARGRFMLLALLGMGLSNMAMGWATQPLPFLLLLFLGGFTFGLSNPLFADIWRRLIPPEQQGRFFGMQSALVQGLMPLGFTLAGVLADRFAPYSVAAGAGGLVVLLALWALSGPGLRDID